MARKFDLSTNAFDVIEQEPTPLAERFYQEWVDHSMAYTLDGWLTGIFCIVGPRLDALSAFAESQSSGREDWTVWQSDCKREIEYFCSKYSWRNVQLTLDI